MQKYLITSQDFYTNTASVFSSKLSLEIEKHHPSYVLYRDKDNPNYNNLAVLFSGVCAQYNGLKSFLHQDVELAKKLGVAGVHLTSNQFSKIEVAKSLGLEVIISTHTHEEVLLAQKLGADAVTYSPIFTSPGKGEPKGVDDLKELLRICKINVFALGGIVSDEQVNSLNKTGVYGFASIRYFQ